VPGARDGGGAAGVEVSPGGVHGQPQPTRAGKRTRPPCLLPRRVQAQCRWGRGRAPGSVSGGCRDLEWREAGVSLSPARPLSRLGKVGRGRTGISELGEGIPGREQRAGALHRLPRMGMCPAHTDTRARRPGIGAWGLAPLEAWSLGWRRPPPSPGFGCSANPPTPPETPGCRALAAQRDHKVSGKSVPPPGGLQGPRGAVSPELRQMSAVVGRLCDP
jgi:hypothetical protein